jgi:LPXTG-motif cell wall-anchored protein
MGSKRILQTGAGIFAGVWLYILALAPLFSSAPYGEAVTESAVRTGVPFTIVIIVMVGIALAVTAALAARRRRREE